MTELYQLACRDLFDGDRFVYSFHPSLSDAQAAAAAYEADTAVAKPRYAGWSIYALASVPTWVEVLRLINDPVNLAWLWTGLGAVRNRDGVFKSLEVS